MGAGASFVRGGTTRVITLTGALAAGDLWQMPDGQAGVNNSAAGFSSGDLAALTTSGQFTIPKYGGQLLDGGRAYWDRSASQVNFKKNGDRDFYVGRVVGDAAPAAGNCVVNLNVDPRYDRELARDPFISALVGTQAAGGFGGPYMRGGAVKLLVSSTNEAQKVDAFGKSADGWDVSALGVVEFALEPVSVGAGVAPDFNIAVANGTNATDFDSVTVACGVHMDGSSLAYKYFSRDGTHTTAFTTGGTDGVAGTRAEIWIDMRVPSDVRFYQDGVRILSGTTFDMSSATTLRLIAHLEKTSAVDTFEADVDWMRVRFNEQSTRT